MALFGKNEKELAEMQAELDLREKTLSELQRSLELQETDLANRDTILDSKAEELALKDFEVGERQRELAEQELNAKNGFVVQQRQAFSDAIATQLELLANREAELNDKQNEIDNRNSELLALQGQIASRDREVRERELKAENGFADLNRISMREIEVRHEQCKLLESRLAKQESSLGKQREKLERERNEIGNREKLVQLAELKIEEEFSEERKLLDDELARKKKVFLQDLANSRIKQNDDLEKSIEQQTEQRLKQFESSLSQKRETHDSQILAEVEIVETKKTQLSELQTSLDELKDDLEYRERRLLSREESLEKREESLEPEIDRRITERTKSYNQQVEVLEAECSRLREAIQNSSKLHSVFCELKQKLGDEDPEKVLLRLETQEEDLRNLREELLSRPTQEMQIAFDRLEAEKGRLTQLNDVLRDENEHLSRSGVEQSRLEMQLAELADEHKSITRRYEYVEADNSRLSSDLKRLQSSYEREQDREARIKDIELPHIQIDHPRSTIEYDELAWLDAINSSCIDYGLKFPRRILHAFHTSLKTSEWSPITVLAGVSGTGKSELPRLYSHFGGVNFLSLSVQPNWDSQESMLGFFNSIDNKFDAQPVLRLLAQSQKKQTEDYPYGLEDSISLILMDEMNLAHVELYFAEFLSKLELRRGRKQNIPKLEVKLGAGVPHYDLPLGRNVLWAGTMNQDETTKSLSDKVLDRGIVINFPRPTTLERRKKLSPLGEQAPLLSRKIWESWWCRESIFSDEAILPYKSFVEDMNISLSKVGRALGHRVWQSIEYYMANYPDVLEAQRTDDETLLSRAMKISFEDQLVQKIMPKLRGIETRGKSKTECLDKIRSQLVDGDYNIVEDFDLSCEFGYGQFIWNSANYLENDELNEDQPKQSEDQDQAPKSVKKSNDGIPLELEQYASKNNKDLWSLSIAEIKKIMSCNAKVAKEYKALVNATKSS
ncbi:chromosome partitioning protein ParA [bacterium]|nr:chromosome partitioning protein ParA [bacterium]